MCFFEAFGDDAGGDGRAVLVYFCFGYSLLLPIRAADPNFEDQWRTSRNIELSLASEFVRPQKKLPNSWDDFLEVRLAKNGSLPQSSFRMKAFNTFSLVPGAPLIEFQSGISKDYAGNRLFMISRRPTTSDSANVGRLAILITPEDIDPANERTYEYFIPEETAQIILKQIKGFDPLAQPLAYENADQTEREEKANDEKAEQFFKDRYRRKKPSEPNRPNEGF